MILRRHEVEHRHEQDGHGLGEIDQVPSLRPGEDPPPQAA
jgi:hypothetical protein